MTMRRMSVALVAAVGFQVMGGLDARAQCCFNDLFAGCGACFKKPPVYAVAPVAAPMVAPVVAPIAAPIAAPPPPVMVPVQQTSYVPETTYRTQYQNVPVTTYKPSCEVDPCTGCSRECMQPVTQYVQQAVNVPVTQYRAVTTTKYVQMQPGYAGGYPAAQPGMAAPGMAAPGMAAPAPAVSPFTAPVQTTPQGWGAAGADIPQQLVPGSAPPASVPQTYQQPITPQTGYAIPVAPQAGIQPQPTQPQPLSPTPSMAPAPSLKPIPELPKTAATPAAPAVGTTAPAFSPFATPAPTGTTTVPPPAAGMNGFNFPGAASPAAGAAPSAAPLGMPVLPGQGPKASTNAFPRLLEPTSHTTSWQPAMLDPLPGGRRPGYPTAALPARLQQ